MLRIAIQAKGRLNEQSIGLLSEAGIGVAESKRKLISRADGFPMEVLRTISPSRSSTCATTTFRRPWPWASPIWGSWG